MLAHSAEDAGFRLQSPYRSLASEAPDSRWAGAEVGGRPYRGAVIRKCRALWFYVRNCNYMYNARMASALIEAGSIWATRYTRTAMSDIGHILVVDDQKEICDMVQDYLSSEGYRVSTAHDGVGMRRIIASIPGRPRDPRSDASWRGGLTLARWLRKSRASGSSC